MSSLADAGLVLELEGESFLGGQAERAGLILRGAMLVSFLFIRTSARLMRSPEVPWWPGSIQTEGGLHVHHLVFGIVLMLLAGFVLALGQDSPWLETRRDWSLLRALDPTIDQSLRRLTIDPKKATGGGGYG